MKEISIVSETKMNCKKRERMEDILERIRHYILKCCCIFENEDPKQIYLKLLKNLHKLLDNVLLAKHF